MVMMTLSRIVASFRTHIVVRRPGVRGVVWKNLLFRLDSLRPSEGVRA
jgi:hypothetical protein